MVRIEIRIERGVIVITSLEWWTRLVPPLASLLWMIPAFVVEVRTVFTGLGVVVPLVSIVATDFAREVQTHGVNRSMDRLFAPFLHLLDQEVQLRGNHIRLFDGMHALHIRLFDGLSM